jgi:hypothetical protein
MKPDTPPSTRLEPLLIRQDEIQFQIQGGSRTGRYVFDLGVE